MADTRHFHDPIIDRHTDPADPPEGSWSLWMSNGSGTGDAGDLYAKITTGGVTKTVPLVDFSTGSLVVTDFFLEVSKGTVAGHSAVQKFGRNNDIDTSASEDIWAGGGTRAYLSSAETMDVASTSANDDGAPAGTGARTIEIQGLNSSYAEISETVTLNGTSAVTTTNSFLRVHRAYVRTAGTVETNDGDITVDPTTSGSGSRQAFVAAGDGQTLISHYTVPAGKTAYMVGGQLSISPSDGSTGVKQAKVRLFIRPENGAWRLQAEFGARSDGTSIAPDIVFTAPISFPAKTDIKWVGTAENNNTSVYVQYNLILVDN